MARYTRTEIVGQRKPDYSLLTTWHTSSPGYYAYDFRDKLLAWYQFDTDVSSAGNLPDLSGNSRNLGPLNSVSSQRPSAPTVDSPNANSPTGFSKSSANFSNSVLEFPDSGSDFSFGNGTKDFPFSVSAWVKFDTLANDQIMVAKWKSSANQREWVLWYRASSASLELRLADGGTVNNYLWRQSKPNKISANTWHSVIATYDGRGGSLAHEGIRIYVDGVDQTSSSSYHLNGTYTAMHDLVSSFTIGNQNDLSTDDFDGKMLEVAVWSDLLPSIYAKAIYNAVSSKGLGRFRSGLLRNPARTVLRDMDNAPGQYPTISRTGDSNFRGNGKIAFDDTKSIFFGSSYAEAVIEFSRFPNTGEFIGLTGSRGGNPIKLDFEAIREPAFHKRLLTSPTPSNLVELDKITRRDFAQVNFRTHNEQLEIIRRSYFTSNTSKTSLNFRDVENKDDLSHDQHYAMSVAKAVRAFAEKINSADFGIIAFGINNKLHLKQTHPGGLTAGLPIALGIADINQASEYLDHGETLQRSAVVKKEFSESDNIARTMGTLHTGIGIGKSSFVSSPNIGVKMQAPAKSTDLIVGSNIIFSESAEPIKPFDESRISLRNNLFYNVGTEPSVLSHFESPLRSKNQIVIEMHSSQKLPIFFSTGASGIRYPDISGKKGSGMAYWNHKLNQWEMQGLNLGGDFPDPYKIYSTNNSTGSCLAFAPDAGDDGLPNEINKRTAVGQPIQQFGFPRARQYNATGSQELLMSNYIDSPFLLEKISVQISGSFGLAEVSQANEGLIQKQFFILNQFTNGDNPHYTDIDFDTEIEHTENSLSNSIKRMIKIKSKGLRELVGFAKINFIPDNNQHLSILSQQNPELTVNLDTGGEELGSFTQDLSDKIVVVPAANFSASMSESSVVARQSKFDGKFEFNFTPSLSTTTEFNSTLSQRNVSNGIFQSGLEVALTNVGGGADLSNVPSGRQIASTIYSSRFNRDRSHYTKFSKPRQIRNQTRRVSPYLLMPKDRLIFGWHNHPICPLYNSAAANHGNRHSITEPSELNLGDQLVDKIHSVKITLFGSQVSNSREVLPITNEPLTTNSVHECVGAEPVLDQFDVDSMNMLSGSSGDALMFGKMLRRSEGLPDQRFASSFGNRGRRGSIVLGHAGSTGSLTRFIKAENKKLKYHDTLVPFPAQIWASLFPRNNIKDIFADSSTVIDASGIAALAGTILMIPPVASSIYNTYFRDNTSTTNIGGIKPEQTATGRWFKSQPAKFPMINGDLLANAGEIGTKTERPGFATPRAPLGRKKSRASAGPFPGAIPMARPASDPFSFEGQKVIEPKNFAIDFNSSGEPGTPSVPPVPSIRYLTTPETAKGVSVFTNAASLSILKDLNPPGLRSDAVRLDLSKFLYGVSAGIDFTNHGGLPAIPITPRLFVAAPRGFKHGIMNTPPIKPSNIYRKNHYGHFRDMLEQAPETYYDVDLSNPENLSPAHPSNTAISGEYDFQDGPVKIIFVSRQGSDRYQASPVGVDPEATNTQNLSIFATSSMPFVEGASHERFTDQPDLLDRVSFGEAAETILDS